MSRPFCVLSQFFSFFCFELIFLWLEPVLIYWAFHVWVSPSCFSWVHFSTFLYYIFILYFYILYFYILYYVTILQTATSALFRIFGYYWLQRDLKQFCSFISLGFCRDEFFLDPTTEFLTLPISVLAFF